MYAKSSNDNLKDIVRDFKSYLEILLLFNPGNNLHPLFVTKQHLTWLDFDTSFYWPLQKLRQLWYFDAIAAVAGDAAAVVGKDVAAIVVVVGGGGGDGDDDLVPVARWTE